MVSTRDHIEGIPPKAEPLSMKTQSSGCTNPPIDLRRCEPAPVAMVSNGFHKHESFMPSPDEPFFPDKPRCESPVQGFCTGSREKCRLLVSDEQKPDVVSGHHCAHLQLLKASKISLGSCEDGEASWEDVGAASGAMMQALIEVLSKFLVCFRTINTVTVDYRERPSSHLRRVYDRDSVQIAHEDAFRPSRSSQVQESIQRIHRQTRQRGSSYQGGHGDEQFSESCGEFCV